MKPLKLESWNLIYNSINKKVHCSISFFSNEHWALFIDAIWMQWAIMINDIWVTDDWWVIMNWIIDEWWMMNDDWLPKKSDWYEFTKETIAQLPSYRELSSGCHGHGGMSSIILCILLGPDCYIFEFDNFDKRDHFFLVFFFGQSKLGPIFWKVRWISGRHEVSFLKID